MNKIYACIIVILLIASVIFLANRNGGLQKSNKLKVTASFYPMYFFAKQIGGDKADVYNITPAGTEPHDYEPTTQDIVRIETSDVLILNGDSLEPWGEKINDDVQAAKPLIVIASNGIANKKMLEDNHTVQDPHVWLDPQLAKLQVKNIEKAFEKADPKDATYFHKNAENLSQKLDQLDAAYTHTLMQCRLHTFVTSHAAFSYLAQQYHLTQVAISGISPDEEPSSKKIAEVTEVVKKNTIPVIYFESLISPKLSDTIAQETGAKTLVLDPLEGVPQNQLDIGANYFTIMQQNLTNLQEGLECAN